MIAVYSGTFDPVTNGHMDIIARSSALADKLIIAVSENRSKQTLFTLSERVQHLEILTKHLDNIEIRSFHGLMVDLLKTVEATCIIRGVRTSKDLEYELQMTFFNKQLSGGHVETVMLPASPEFMHISSTAVKEVLRYDGDTSQLVPPYIHDRLAKKLRGKT